MSVEDHVHLLRGDDGVVHPLTTVLPGGFFALGWTHAGVRQRVRMWRGMDGSLH